MGPEPIGRKSGAADTVMEPSQVLFGDLFRVVGLRYTLVLNIIANISKASTQTRKQELGSSIGDKGGIVHRIVQR